MSRLYTAAASIRAEKSEGVTLSPVITTNGGPHESAAHPVPVIDPHRRHALDKIDATAGGGTRDVATTSAQIVAGEGALIASATLVPQHHEEAEA
jgi:hypothetical protein